MQARKSIVELAREVQAIRAEKHDYIVPSQRMSMDTNGMLNVMGYGRYELGKIAHEQMATKLQIPKKYYDRMMAGSPELLAHNVNHWLWSENDARMVRTVGSTARAILSDRYRPIDNEVILEAVLPTLLEHRDYQILASEITERRLYLQVVSPRLQGEVRTGEVVQQGLTISNSEVGLGSVRIEPLLYILKCLNGAIMSTALRKYHVGRRIEMDGEESIYSKQTIEADSRAFMLKIKDTVLHSFDELAFQETLQRTQIAANNKIVGAISDTIEEVTKRYEFSVPESQSILKNLIEGGDLSQWGMSNAVTAVANTVDDYDRVIELQRIGGDIIALDGREWAKIAG